jgi:hypothetical protein
MTKWFIFTALLLVLLPATALADQPEGEQLYIVQADDWLARLAEKFYGDSQAAPLIVAATNTRAAAADGIAPVENAKTLAVGQPLVIPPVEDVSLALQTLAAQQDAPTPAQQETLAGLSALGQPPELFNEVWLNSEPLKLADLHGKVVIVEFWTFG